MKKQHPRLAERAQSIRFAERPERMLTTTDAVALTIGTMVGAGIFTVLALTFRTAGPGAVISWVFVVLLSLPMAYTFSDLTGILAQSGGPFVYVRDHVSPFLGYWIAWSFLLSSVGATEALFVSFIGMIRQIGWPFPYLFACSVLAFLALVVAMGIHMGARVQRLFTLATVVILVFAIAIGFAHAHQLWPWLSQHAAMSAPRVKRTFADSMWREWFPDGMMAVLPATFFAFWTYSGWEAVAVPTGAYADRAALGRGMRVGSIVVGVLYVLVALSAALAVPASRLSEAVNPLVEVGQLWNSAAATSIAVGALIIVSGSLLAWLISSAALLQALMKDRVIPAPAWMRRVQADYHPLLAVAVAAAVAVGARFPIFSGAVAASSQTALAAYVAVFLSVAINRNADWPGVFSRPARRRTVAALAALSAMTLMAFGGWANLWPALLLLAIGGIGLELQRRLGAGAFRETPRSDKSVQNSR